MWPFDVLLRSSKLHPLRALLLACGFGGLGLILLVLVGTGLGGGTSTAATAATPVAPPAPVAPAQVVPAPVLPPAPAGPPAPAAAPAAKEERAGGTYYERVARKKVTRDEGASFLPLYQEAERVFGVSWQLVAAVHRQETAFSTVEGTYEGLNAFGCCAGPMQFNVTNGPVTTWKSYKASFKQGTRPARYPHRTAFHPSVYDDFDAIMAAGALLRDGGATRSLDGGSWLAAYGYYGRDTFGVTYASQVLGRAQGWARGGFCPDCADDPKRVAALDDAYGVAARLELMSAEERAEADRKAAAAKKRAAAKRKRAAAKKERANAEATARERSAAKERAAAKKRAAAAEERAATAKPKAAEPAPPAAKKPEPAQPDAPTPPPPAPTGPTAAEPAPPAETGSTCTNVGRIGC